MSGTDPILELRGVNASYGKVRALHGISLKVSPGEVVALIGANGAGKTTTLRVMSGLIGVTSGEILLDGASIARQRPDTIVRKGVAHCPEERRIWPELTVYENLALGAYICVDQSEVKRRMEAMLAQFPRLRERSVQMAGTLSGGEQQMLAIGRALMSAPRILLLDEPSLGLSPLIMQEVLTIIRQLRDQGITIVLVEQNVHNALSVANRAYVFTTGQIVAEDTAVGLLKNPNVLRAYLGG
jgi:branched-chain amino acid transport system ATP-binding protein